MLTKRKRKILFYLSILAFLLLLVPALLYSLGYAIDGNFSLSKTGGIFIQSSESGAVVNAGRKTKHTSLLGSSAIIKNLLPGNYKVSITKDGFWDWQKTLTVSSEAVSSRNVLLVPKNIPGKMIGTSTPKETRMSPPYPSVQKYWRLSSGDFLIFGEDKNFYLNKEKIGGEFPPEALEILKTAPNAIFTDGDKRIVFWDGRNIDSLWIGDADAMPQWQTEPALPAGRKEISVFTSPPGSEIREIFEYPNWNDYLIVSFSNGVFALEIERDGGQNIFPIYKGKLPEIVSVEPGKLIVKDDGNFIELEIP